jgi:hypothetical protein
LRAKNFIEHFQLIKTLSGIIVKDPKEGGEGGKKEQIIVDNMSHRCQQYHIVVCVWLRDVGSTSQQTMTWLWVVAGRNIVVLSFCCSAAEANVGVVLVFCEVNM